MLKKYGRFFVIAFASMSPCTVFCAGNPISLSKNNTIFSFLASSWVASLNIGPSWQSAGKRQTLTLAPDIDKTYTADQSQYMIADYALFLGIQKPLTEKISGQLGLEMATTEDAILSGNIWDDADPQFNNYTYEYHIRHSQIALKGKLLADINWPVLPWISAAVGVGFNRSFQFTNTPSIYEVLPSPNFSSKTITTVSYALGIGIERMLNQQWQFGIGYEFADWGRSKLGAVSGSTTHETLSLSHLYTESLIFNITYLA